MTSIVCWQYFLINDFFSNPSAVQHPEVLIITKGKNESVRCQATGSTKPQMKWSRSGGDLPAGRAQPLANGTLKLTDVQWEDAGEYACTASIGKFEFTVGKMLLIWPGKPMTVSQYRTCSLTHLREDSVPYLHRMKHQDLTASKVFAIASSVFNIDQVKDDIERSIEDTAGFPMQKLKPHQNKDIKRQTRKQSNEERR